MKKIILLLLFLPLMVSANDFTASFTETWVAADTAADAARHDTVYTPIFDIRDYSTLQFYWTSGKYGNKTIPVSNFDTTRVVFQASPDKNYWTSWQLDAGVVAVDSGWSTVVLTTDSVIGNYGRGMFIRRDSVAADSPDSIDLERSLLFKLWLVGRK